ncbi:MAG: DUF1684 domain-containing protein, partial [Acidobacteria bacterium]|nr:DUF1684 domain-containing protein [Acidobacteriota bacterium]
FGSSPLNDIVLPDSAPPEIGVFEYRGGKLTARIKDGVTVLQRGKPVKVAEFKVGVAQDALVVGDLTMWMHYSGDRHAIRVRDKNSALRREFTGCKWFPIDEKFRVTGRFQPYAKPKPVQFPNILGDFEKYDALGLVEFTLDGQRYKMEGVRSGPATAQRLFFVFRDLTSGKESYPSARFLYADMPKQGDPSTPIGAGPSTSLGAGPSTSLGAGEVVLDFNQAQNPPCAFNPYTTCPLPPEQNRLRVRVPAGEKNYHVTSQTHTAGGS